MHDVLSPGLAGHVVTSWARGAAEWLGSVASMRVCRTPVFDVEEDDARIGGEVVEGHEI